MIEFSEDEFSQAVTDMLSTETECFYVQSSECESEKRDTIVINGETTDDDIPPTEAHRNRHSTTTIVPAKKRFRHTTAE